MKHFHRLLFAAAVCVAFATAGVHSAFSAETIKIGFVFSMTGGAAVYGASQKEGAQLAVDQINAAAGGGLKIAPVFEDDATAADQASRALRADQQLYRSRAARPICRI